MNYGRIITSDTANGPGMRVSVFVSGCRNKCPGCFNKETWDFNYGKPFEKDTLEKLIYELNKIYYQGITILGGEPFEPENQQCVFSIIEEVRNRCPKRDIWVYTGYTIENLPKTEYTEKILKNIDCVVDGRFLIEQKDLTIRFRGSRNQRLIDVQKTLKMGEVITFE